MAVDFVAGLAFGAAVCFALISALASLADRASMLTPKPRELARSGAFPMRPGRGCRGSYGRLLVSHFVSCGSFREIGKSRSFARAY